MSFWAMSPLFFCFVKGNERLLDKDAHRLMEKNLFDYSRDLLK